MLSIATSGAARGGFCDRLPRRDLLRAGTLLGLGGACGDLSLPRLLAAEAAAGGGRAKSVIMIYLVGGPPHQDMFDLKPHAPREVAGPWKPIRTNVPGIEICEAFPRLAALADRYTILRAIVGNQADHDAAQVFHGRDPRRPKPAGGWPQFGSVVSSLQGPASTAAPPFVSLCYQCTHGPYNEPGPGFAGAAHAPFRAIGTGRDSLELRGVSLDRLHDRRRLLSGVDRLRREIDAGSSMRGMDAFTDRAVGLLTSPLVADALDLSKEDPRVVERYGTGDPTVFIDENGAPRVPQSMLVARRLIEAGVRVVTLNYSKWDWHGGPGNSIFAREAEDFPIFDRALSALVEDLHQRGLDRDCAVVVWGEFGRTPKISDIVGRDHWPQVNQAFLAGGGWRHGQVIGATDRLGAEAAARPVTFGDVYATLFRHLGIDPASTTLTDNQGRPQYLAEDGGTPIAELL